MVKNRTRVIVVSDAISINGPHVLACYAGHASGSYGAGGVPKNLPRWIFPPGTIAGEEFWLIEEHDDNSKTVRLERISEIGAENG